MRDQYPYPEYDAVRSILAGILLSLITCGIYGLYWQYKQMETLNAWLKRDEYSFWQWFFFYLLTCGIYGIYYEYRMASGINEVQENNKLRVDTSLPATCVLLAIFGVGIASLAIQQHHINKFYNTTQT